MTTQMPQSYKQAIYHTFHDIVDVSYPDIRGRQNNLFFIKTSKGDYVAKFNSFAMVSKNMMVSKLAANSGIKTPDISLGGYNGTWFEYYPMIENKTMYEHIRGGMPMHVIKRAFEEILTQFVYMENLPTEQISGTKCINIHETAYAHAMIANGPVIANMLRTIVYLLNHGKKHNIGLYHTDVTPKNVIVDANGKLISFLDMDSMAICNRNFAFCVIADKWAGLGFNMAELYDKYEYLAGRPIGRLRIDAIHRTIHAGKSLMYHMRKQR